MKNTIIKETFIYFLSSFLVAILGFGLSLLYSKMFLPEAYGTFALVNSIYQLITQLFCGWISLSILRKFEQFRKKNLTNTFITSFVFLHIIMSIIFFIIVNLVLFLLNINKIFKIMYFILSIVYFFEQGTLLLNTVLRASQQAKQYSINTVLVSCLKIVSLLVLYYLLNYKSIVIILISLLISNILQFLIVCRKVKIHKYLVYKNFNFKIIKEMFLYGFPLVGLSITNWILNVSDRFIIKIFKTIEDVGKYSYSYSLGNSLFSLLIQFIMLGAYPNIVKVWENESKEATEKIISKYVTMYLIIIIPSCFGVLLISKDFFQLFVSKDYFESYTCFIITCISIALLGLSHYYNKAWELTSKPKTVLYLNIMASLINIVLNIIFIPRFGYVVGAYTTLLSYLIYIIVACIVSRHILVIRYDVKSIIKILLSNIIMILIYYIFNYIFTFLNLYVKFFLLLVILLFTYVLMLLLLGLINKYNIKSYVKRIFRLKRRI